MFIVVGIVVGAETWLMGLGSYCCPLAVGIDVAEGEESFDEGW
jgi:hypothetical protein